MSEWEQYEVLCMLGRGKYGFVSRARHKKLGSLVALKSVLSRQEIYPNCDKEDQDSNSPPTSNYLATSREKLVTDGHVAKLRNSLHHEARVLAALSHPGLVSLVEICVKNNGDLVLAMEDLGGMSLTGLVQKHSKTSDGLCESLVGCVANHIAKALNYLHSRGYLHRDIKPDNIMVQNIENCFPRAKLIDLGLSMEFKDIDLPNTSETRAGTLAYMAPELMLPDTKYGPKIDLFSLGASLYYALVGEEPFMAYTSEGGQRTTTSVFGIQIQHEDIFEEMSPDVSKVIKSLLQMQPSERWSTGNMLRSSWLKCSAVGSSFAEHSATALPRLVDWLALEQHLPITTRFCTINHCTYNKSMSNSESCKSSCSSSMELSITGVSDYTDSSVEKRFHKLNNCLNHTLSSSENTCDSVCSSSPIDDAHFLNFSDCSIKHSNKVNKNENIYLKNKPYDSDEDVPPVKESLCRSGNVCRVFGLKDRVCRGLSPSYCWCVAPIEDREEATVEAVALVLEQDATTVLERMVKKPWGEAAGIYNLLKMKDRRKFSSVINDVLMNMHENSEGADEMKHTL